MSAAIRVCHQRGNSMNPGTSFSIAAALRSPPARFREPALNALLVLTILLVFVVGPLEEAGVASRWILNVQPILMGIVAFFVVAGRRLILFGFGLSAAGLLFEGPLSAQLPAVLAATTSGLLFSATIISTVASAIPRQGPITTSHIRGAVTIYLSIAILFAMLTNLLYQFIPAGYSNIDPARRLADVLYFSLSILTCSGYGDILPMHPLTRSLTNLEAVVGQLYIAVVIGALVGLRILVPSTRGTTVVRRADEIQPPGV
jgi:hypothetical protein